MIFSGTEFEVESFNNFTRVALSATFEVFYDNHKKKSMFFTD